VESGVNGVHPHGDRARDYVRREAEDRSSALRKAFSLIELFSKLHVKQFIDCWCFVDALHSVASLISEAKEKMERIGRLQLSCTDDANVSSQQ
jgi:hypothetical protein